MHKKEVSPFVKKFRRYCSSPHASLRLHGAGTATVFAASNTPAARTVLAVEPKVRMLHIGDTQQRAQRSCSIGRMWRRFDSDRASSFGMKMHTCRYRSQYDRDTFNKWFRMPPQVAFLLSLLAPAGSSRYGTSQVFDVLYARVGPLLTRRGAPRRADSITPLQCCLIALMRMGSRGEGRHVAQHFYVSETVVQQSLDHFCFAVAKHLHGDYIRRPATADEVQQITQAIREQRGLPACVGGLDGKHWQIRRACRAGSRSVPMSRLSVAAMDERTETRTKTTK